MNKQKTTPALTPDAPVVQFSVSSWDNRFIRIKALMLLDYLKKDLCPEEKAVVEKAKGLMAELDRLPSCAFEMLQDFVRPTRSR